MLRVQNRRATDAGSLCRREVTAFYAETTDADEAERLAEEVCSAFESIADNLSANKTVKRKRAAFQRQLSEWRALLPSLVPAESVTRLSAALDLLSHAVAGCVRTTDNRCPYDSAIAFAIHIYAGLYPQRRLASTRGSKNKLRLHLNVLRDLMLPLAPTLPTKISEAHLAELIAKSSKFEASKTDTPNL